MEPGRNIRKPKFKVGQVVYFAEHESYVKIAALFDVAGGSRKIVWVYNVVWGFAYLRQGVDERKLRPLTKRERG